MLIHNIGVPATDVLSFQIRGCPSDQYEASVLRREIRKAYVGLHGIAVSCALLLTVRSGSIAADYRSRDTFRSDVGVRQLLRCCVVYMTGGHMLDHHLPDKLLTSFDDVYS
ncbi:hypothetical_protein [Leishmania braziliensis MHOM/BR/75/M2904]|uniref:Hypothetical_protein n=1 Tax=Leishmania braziliensis MHOM/BR/75/M2904 TaxID=420245 RepID=A0A3P3ZH23_LEIBR|nr:unnamed protein product [Leishmania braziliensis]SYZ69571.1 hypothetical_protein [Leishmania braziliensis MHOM/BR/75/M2904]